MNAIYPTIIAVSEKSFAEIGSVDNINANVTNVEEVVAGYCIMMAKGFSPPMSP